MRLLVLGVLAVALAGCGGKKTVSASPGTTDTTTRTTTVDSHGCRPVETPGHEKRSAPKPKQELDRSKTYDVALETDCGGITIQLDVKDSPHTTASFVSLVRRGYFRDTAFHRIVPSFVIQGGDPTGTGTSGPGYTTVDRPPKGTRYEEGVVAMAKTQAEPAGTAGSQFFVVIGPDAATLPPDYALLGHVTKGLDVAKRIGDFGDPNDPSGAPLRPVVIEKAAVHVH